jgi:hypothetical protein
MRRANCPACRGIGLDCEECSDRGWVWGFDLLAPCNPRCPVGADGELPTGEMQKQNAPYRSESGGIGDSRDTSEQPPASAKESSDPFAPDEGTSRSRGPRKGTGS